MTDNLELEKDAYLPLRDVVFQTLRTAILRGELKPGERLMELQLAAKLGVSRTPIREAIRKLEQEGLAVTIPRKGAEVARITAKDVDDVLEIREALEVLVARLACSNITRDEIQQLKEAGEQFRKMTKNSDITAIAAADEDFHNILYYVSDNPKLLALLSNLREQMYRYRVEYLKDVSVYPQLIEEHEQLYEAVKRGDADAAENITRIHLQNQSEGVKRILSENADS